MANDSPTFIVPREFGAILACGGELYHYDMTPEEQLSLATRFIEVATQRFRNGEVEGHKDEADLG